MHDSGQTQGEVILRGIAAAPGIAVGPAYLYARQIPSVEMKQILPADVDGEIERLRTATTRAAKELRKIHLFAEQKLGSESATIFEAQTMILADDILMGTIEKRIREEGKNAEWMVADEISKYRRLMLASPEEHMHERAHDVDDVMHRIIRNIQDQKLYSRLDGASVIISENLTPADTVIFSRNQILGYATDLGGVTSHAALLSRSLKIPAVVGLHTATKLIRTGDPLAIDGYAGTLVIRPTPATLALLEAKAQKFQAFEEALAGIAGLPAETPDKRRIELSANIEFAEEIEFAKVQGAEGIGLFRTETQLIGKGDYPGEDEQYELYRKVAESVFPHQVIFRTFDVGGDKLAPGAHHEENPFLGWRGIRVFLSRTDLFLCQLRAMLRASARKKVRIMFPMVSTLKELRQAKELLHQAREDLRARGVPFSHKLKVGVMIEVPAAALMAEQLAAEVDFLSIGTNDLIQYTMAVDRGNASVASLFQPFNPAVLRLIKSVIDAAHRRNVWVGMCGEMAGDPLATVPLLGMGIDELSVVPSVLPEIKKIIRSIKHRDARRVADHILGMASEEEIRDYLSAVIRNKVPDIPLETS